MSDEIKVGDTVVAISSKTPLKVIYIYTNEQGCKYCMLVSDNDYPFVYMYDSLQKVPEIMKVWVICYQVLHKDPVTYMVYNQERAEELVNTWTKHGYKIFGVKCVEFEV